ncbi:MAG: ribokinase [Sphaerochaeta sp.]|uniref:ribokinase n=1 Tax=Sphaerochaeta sp. TaxID=1972642 RepID=UPI002A36B700|nr:ribokinase [Sphaerochaeta sp.]MCK9598117.1 ribokinase [Sphaerochaeta sp.]MDX9825093.1 ribokinase [Sphaerochaeta sp.]HPE92869.1 ribokinase [Sphaerochaeta sp.]
MRFLNYGSVNIDLIFTVDHIVKGGETLQSTSLTRSAGGKGANQSAALAKAGATVFHAGKVGRDGDFLLQLLTSYGVDVSHIRTYDGATGQALIQLDANKQNAIILYSGGNGAITTDEIDRTLEHFGFGDVLVLQNEIVHIDYLIKNAKRRGMKVCMNVAPFDPSALSLPLELIDILVVNEIEGAGLADMRQTSDYKAILERLVTRYPASEILLTIGKQGCWYAFKDLRVHHDIYDTPVVDTTAAGDTFIGYYLASIARGCSIRQALQYASKAAGLAVSRPGAMASIPLAEEVFS